MTAVELFINDDVMKDIDVEIDISYDDVEFDEPAAYAIIKFNCQTVNFLR